MKKRKNGDGNISPGGYFRITVDGERIFYHRYIMEKHLGRKLKPFPIEVIDHINGDRLDNRIENLRLISQSDHVIYHKPRKVVVDWDKYSVPEIPKGKHSKGFVGCLVDGCQRKHRTRGLCNKHYISYHRNVMK